MTLAASRTWTSLAAYIGWVLPDDARELARSHLAVELPQRWAHVRAVATKATEVAEELQLDPSVLVSAAWLHDIGYARGIAASGFHPLDGARFLRARGVDERVVTLVAHHSCATVEAEERGLDDELIAEFARIDGALSDALWFCDMTIGPDGASVAVEQRLTEIRSRYGPGHVVTRFIDRAEGDIRAAAERTVIRLGEANRN
jgi:putative nucleotidyltransferase with HDIG domain